MSSKSSAELLKLDWCSFNAAKFACLNWHYSKAVPSGKMVKIGVWERGSFRGVILFGRGANNHMLMPFGLAVTEGAELVRVALREHETPVTRMISVALCMLKRNSPGLKAVVSFADPEQGHIGGIYQGGGWLYTGKSVPMPEYMVHGTRVHGRTASALKSQHPAAKSMNRLTFLRRHVDPNATELMGSSKHRYLWVYDRKLLKKLQALPYPKDSACAVVDGARVPPEQGVRPDPHAQ